MENLPLQEPLNKTPEEKFSEALLVIKPDNTSEVSNPAKALDHVITAIDGYKIFSFDEDKLYKQIIETIKSLLDEIVKSNKTIEEKKALCVQKAELIGKLPRVAGLRQKVIEITTIPDLESTDFLK